MYLLWSSLVSASTSTTNHAPTGIPDEVYWQIANFAIYAALLFYFLRKPIVEYFKGRKVNFNSALTKAQAARDEAENRRNEIKRKLNELEKTADESIAIAKKESAEIRVKLIAEAEQLSKSIRLEAERTAATEIEKAKSSLRDEMLDLAITAAQKALKEKTVDSEQKRLQSEFVDKIQLVQ